MKTLKIDKKIFIVIEQNKFSKIQLLAAQKNTIVKKISLNEGKKHALKHLKKLSIS